ncbi:MAG TPA: glycosyltransferase, partial [Gaiellaceae bacterium]
MRVLYFGTYERRYPRNAQVISCLRRAGVEVVEQHEPVWEGKEEKWAAGAGSAARLALAEARLLARRPPVSADIVLVGYPGHLDLPAARRAARGRPVVFNPLVSLSDTLVGDRGRFVPRSLPARVLRRIDRRAFRSADLVVADTAAHADFLAELAGLPRNRFEVCFVGAEERLFQPGWSPEEPFTALFVGKLIPLHGLETIIEAARLAPELRIRIVGSGQLDRLLATRPPNVDWVPWVEYEHLAAKFHAASCALGIFGTSDKAQRVIPNKAFQALACGTP